jgi:hypothetical protein
VEVTELDRLASISSTSVLDKQDEGIMETLKELFGIIGTIIGVITGLVTLYAQFRDLKQRKSANAQTGNSPLANNRLSRCGGTGLRYIAAAYAATH